MRTFLNCCCAMLLGLLLQHSWSSVAMAQGSDPEDPRLQHESEATPEQGAPGILENVQINLLDGSSIRGSILSIEESGAVFGEGLPEGLTIDSVLSIQTGTVVVEPAGIVAIELTGGSRIPVNSLLIENEAAQFHSGCGLSGVKLESIRGVVWSESELVRDKLDSPPADSDIVIARSSSGVRSLECLLESVTADSVAISFKGNPETIAIEKVQAIVVADIGLDFPEGVQAVVRMIDGSVIKGVIGTLKYELDPSTNSATGSSTLSMRIPGNTVLELDGASIAEISIDSDNLVYLSELDPVNVEQKTSFTIERQWQRDLSVTGKPLTLAWSGGARTETYIKGIGTSSYSRLDFENSNDFDRFSATVGIDIEAEGRGDCNVSIRGDGIVLWSKRIRGSTDPETVSVDISGLKEISLIVEPGEQFDLADHVDWAEARFTRSN